MMLRAILAAGLFALAGSANASARELSVSLRADGPVSAMQHVYVEPFVASGTPAEVSTRPGGLESLLAGAAAWDVVEAGGATVAAACQAGALEKLDWAALGGRERMVPAGATDCGLGAYADAIVLSWDRLKLQGSPSWQDFWDIAKVPGKRGLRRSARGTLEIALLADGVAPGDVYRTLATKDGVERAFRRLDQLAPYLVWWTPGAHDGMQLLGSGQVLMTSATSSSVVQSNRTGGRSFGLQWAGGLVWVEYWAIVKGTPNLAEAQRFLTFAATAKVQSGLPEAAALGGVAKGANEGLPPEQIAVSPTANAGTLFIDEAFWRDNGDKLQQRFDAWVAH